MANLKELSSVILKSSYFDFILNALLYLSTIFTFRQKKW